MDAINDAAKELNEAGGQDAFRKALEGLVPAAALEEFERQQPEEFQRWSTRWPWLVRMGVWCPPLDEADGVSRAGSEQARHAYYRGVITTALARIIGTAERRASGAVERQAVAKDEETEWQPKLLKILGGTAYAVNIVAKLDVNRAKAVARKDLKEHVKKLTAEHNKRLDERADEHGAGEVLGGSARRDQEEQLEGLKALLQPRRTSKSVPCSGDVCAMRALYWRAAPRAAVNKARSRCGECDKVRLVSHHCRGAALEAMAQPAARTALYRRVRRTTPVEVKDNSELFEQMADGARAGTHFAKLRAAASSKGNAVVTLLNAMGVAAETEITMARPV
jgi:hypothetical protein